MNDLVAAGEVDAHEAELLVPHVREIDALAGVIELRFASIVSNACRLSTRDGDDEYTRIHGVREPAYDVGPQTAVHELPAVGRKGRLGVVAWCGDNVAALRAVGAHHADAPLAGVRPRGVRDPYPVRRKGGRELEMIVLSQPCRGASLHRLRVEVPQRRIDHGRSIRRRRDIAKDSNGKLVVMDLLR